MAMCVRYSCLWRRRLVLRLRRPETMLAVRAALPDAYLTLREGSAKQKNRLQILVCSRFFYASNLRKGLLLPDPRLRASE